jgi:lipoprotein NlpI
LVAPLAGVCDSFANSTISRNDMRELQAQPAAEQKLRLDKVLAAHPDDIAARYMRIQAEFDLQDTASVLADSDLVLAAPSLEPDLRRRVLEDRAESLINLGRFDDAVVAANQALAISSSNARTLFARGWARFFAGEKGGALADLDRALRMDPDDGIGYYRRGRVLEAQGAFDRAAKDFGHAIELAPDDIPSRMENGVLLYRAHDLEQALAQFDAYERLSPNEPIFVLWHAQTNRALQRFDAAAADDSRVGGPGFAQDDVIDALHDVAFHLTEQQDFAGAAHAYKRSLALKFDPGIVTNLARMQLFSGQFGPALDTFRELGVSPTSDDYRAIWLFVVRGRANPADEPSAQAELASLTQPHRPHAWTDTLVSLLLGKTTLDAALAEADAAETPKLKAGRRCEADYYAAEQVLMHGQQVTASRLLEEASRICPSTYVEANAVGAERHLIALSSPPTK